MKSALMPLAIFLIATLFTSCAPSRYTQDSGATNVLQVSFNEPGISYAEASVPLDGKSWGGLLIGAQTNYAIDASVIHNNNGDKTRVNASGGGNFIAFCTGLSECFSIAGSLAYIFPPDDVENTLQPLRALGIGVVSFFTAAAINDAFWSGFNQRRVRIQANTQIMEMTEGAHFYCMPQSQISVQPRLFSTVWNGESSLIAGTIENVPVIEGRSMIQNQQPTNNIESAAVEDMKSITLEPSELLGAKGQYRRSKNTYTSFSVVSVEKEADELSECIITIEFLTVDGEMYRKKVRASNEDLIYETPGSN